MYEVQITETPEFEWKLKRRRAEAMVQAMWIEGLISMLPKDNYYIFKKFDETKKVLRLRPSKINKSILQRPKKERWQTIPLYGLQPNQWFIVDLKNIISS